MPVLASSRSAIGRGLFPDDLLLEFYADTTDGAGDSSITLLTDTQMIGSVAWMCPVTKDTSAAAVSAPTLGASPAYVGEASKVHNVYMIGGRGAGASQGYIPTKKFAFRESVNNPTPDMIIWEIVKKTLSGGTATITYADDCVAIRRGAFAIPVQIIAAAPTACGISSITEDTAVLRGGATDTIWTLVGGLPFSATVVAGNYPSHRPPLILHNLQRKSSGALVGEIIEKTLDGASPSKVTITAANDCAYIRHIEMVIPVSKKATAVAVGWSGTQGATTLIYSANSETSIANCLVLGR